jgi:hypothetical protein
MWVAALVGCGPSVREGGGTVLHLPGAAPPPTTSATFGGVTPSSDSGSSSTATTWSPVLLARGWVVYDPDSDTPMAGSYLVLQAGTGVWKTHGYDESLTDQFCETLMALDEGIPWDREDAYAGLDSPGGFDHTTCADAAWAPADLARFLVEALAPWGLGLVEGSDGMVDGVIGSGQGAWFTPLLDPAGAGWMSGPPPAGVYELVGGGQEISVYPSR